MERRRPFRLRPVLACALLFFLAAWPVTPAVARPVRIVASFYPMYVAALNVAGGIPGVEVENLTRPMTGCLHDYHLTPADLTRLAGADIFIVNGGGMEGFLDKALAQLPRLVVVRASEGIAVLDAPGEEGGNPHVWVSVSRHIRQIGNIAAGLERADPARAAAYAANAAAYAGRLERLRAAMHEGLAVLGTRQIVTFHEAFAYFAQEFDLHVAAVIEREPGSEPSARELADTITIVRKAGVRALFAEPQYPAKPAETIARETGARVFALDPVVTGPPRADAYVTIMERNLRVLQEALR